MARVVGVLEVSPTAPASSRRRASAAAPGRSRPPCRPSRARRPRARCARRPRASRRPASARRPRTRARSATPLLVVATTGKPASRRAGGAGVPRVRQDQRVAGDVQRAQRRGAHAPGSTPRPAVRTRSRPVPGVDRDDHPVAAASPSAPSCSLASATTSSGSGLPASSVSASVSASAARSAGEKNGASCQAATAYSRCSVSPAGARVLGVHVDAVGAAVEHRGAQADQLAQDRIELEVVRGAGEGPTWRGSRRGRPWRGRRRAWCRWSWSAPYDAIGPGSTANRAR